jgi:hypothetical protein
LMGLQIGFGERTLGKNGPGNQAPKTSLKLFG